MITVKFLPGAVVRGWDRLMPNLDQLGLLVYFSAYIINSKPQEAL